MEIPQQDEKQLTLDEAAINGKIAGMEFATQKALADMVTARLALTDIIRCLGGMVKILDAVAAMHPAARRYRNALQTVIEQHRTKVGN